MNNNRFKLELNGLSKEDILDINNFLKANPSSKVVIRFNNTVGVTSNSLCEVVNSPNITFRVAGGYDEERKKRTNNYEYYENKNYYSKVELTNIIRTFEFIERGIKDTYSPLEKAYYIYNKLKRYITYDYNYNSVFKKDIDNLLGIIYRKTSSYGFSLIFKEMLDRAGIKNMFVEGNNMRYAWNIIENNGKYYLFDLSYDSELFHFAGISECRYFGKFDKELFSKYHVPLDTEVITDYNLISQIEDIDLVNINHLFHSSRQRLKALKYVRSNKTSFIISGLEIIKGEIPLYKYLYCDYASNGRMNNPKILISEINIFQNITTLNKLSEQIKYLEGIGNKDNTYKKREDELKTEYAKIKKIDDYIVDVFLSTESVLELGEDIYIGYFSLEGNEFIRSRNPKYINKVSNNVRKYRRDDGSVFIIEKVKNINELFYYNYYEFYQGEDDYLEVEVNNFITDNDILLIDKSYDKYVANVFFYKKRLLDVVNEVGGYMGYCNYGENNVNRVVNMVNNNVYVEE